MQIRNIDEHEKEHYRGYIDLLVELNGKADKLSEVIYDNKRFIVANSDFGVGIVVEDGNSLKPFFINLDDPLYEVFGNSQQVYNIFKGEMKEVVETDSEGNELRVSYLVPTEEFTKYILIYSQYQAKTDAILEFGYDVTNRNSLDFALGYTGFNFPDNIKFFYLKEFLWWAYKKKAYYNLSVDDNKLYYSPLFVWNETPYGIRKDSFSANKLMEQFENCGFSCSIPLHIQSLIRDDNPEYKVLKLINNEYKNYLREQ